MGDLIFVLFDICIAAILIKYCSKKERQKRKARRFHKRVEKALKNPKVQEGLKNCTIGSIDPW